MLNSDSEDIHGMDDDAGDEQEPPPTGRWAATSSYDIYMVDTPKETNGDEATGDNPSGKKSKHGHHRRRSKPATTTPTLEKKIQMVPKRNTLLIKPPSSKPNRNTGSLAQTNRR